VRSIVSLLVLGLLALLPGCAVTTLGLALAPIADQAAAKPIEPPRPEELPKPLAETPLLPAPVKSGEGQSLDTGPSAPKPIDLPTALQLADARNPLVAFTRERIQQAYAQLQRADVLWLPSVRAGVGYNHHDGAIQTVEGDQITTSRNGLYSGLGASDFAGGAPIIPGIWANFQLADAIFQPLAAQQAVGARRAAAGATLNDTLLKVALAYLELLRARQDLAIADETRSHAQALADLTQSYAAVGEGLKSDADRAATELALRANNVVRAKETIAVASLRLAELLHLPPTVEFDPIEPAVVPLDVSPDRDQTDCLVAQALSARPELAEARSLVGEAIARWKREVYAPLVPSVMLGVSDGGLTSGIGTDYAPGHNRYDMDAVAFWELRNLGFGDQAARRGAKSEIEQSRWRQAQRMDQVAREVAEAQVQVRARREQIKIAEGGLKVAQESYQLNVDRIREAKGLPIEDLQSLEALDQARREYLRAVIDYNSAEFTLLWALGWPDYSSVETRCPDH